MRIITNTGIDLTNSILRMDYNENEKIILDSERLLQDLYSYIQFTNRVIVQNNVGVIDGQKPNVITYKDPLVNVANVANVANVDDVVNDIKTINVLSIDPRFIFAVDQKIIELIAIPNEESDLNNFKNKYKIDAETWVKIKELKNEFNNEKTKLEQEKPNCPSCEVGALNRKYITKLLPYLESEVGNKFLEDLDTLFLKYHQGVDLETLKLNFKETKALLQQMDEELKNQTKDGKLCSTCAMNSLKNKYLQLSKGIFKKAEKEHEISIQ